MHIELLEIANFRKLKSVRIGVADETTVFVGANNSGKTSAMIALRYFLVERERSQFSLNDFTLSHWPAIDQMGCSWESAKKDNTPLPEPVWEPMLPFLDVWLHVDKREAHLVQKLIPSLDWDGGRLGVRLRLEPKDALQLQKEYLAARDDARRIEAAEESTGDEEGSDKQAAIVLWPRSLTDFMQRRFSSLFAVQSYILDPERLEEPEHGIAKTQALPDDPVPIGSEPFKGLIRIDEISAQRGFGQVDGLRDFDDDGALSGSTATRRMSDQLRRYWSKHLDPFENPDPQDIEALRAIDKAQQAFDARLKDGFSPAIQEVEGMGYPGVTDPKLKISTRLKPVDGLNHDAAVQYVITANDGESSIELNLPEDSNGLGYQNLISMIFRLMSFRDAWMRVGKAAAATDALIPPLHLVLIEEPEAHLHTQVQQVFIRQAYKVLRKHDDLGNSESLKTQLVVSTHSSHIAHECDFDHLRYFRRLPSDGNVVPTSCVVNLGSVFGSRITTKRFVTRYLKVTHCDLFFADAAVFVEGPAERILVPFFVRNDPDLAALHECYITWLEIGGSHAHRLRRLVEHLGLTTLIITDLDAKGANGKKAVPQKGAGLTTRNQILRSWCPAVRDLDTLLSLSADAKSKRYEDQRFSVRAAYQCPVEIEFKGSKAEALCNTLEDALVMENQALFTAHTGTGLWAKFKAVIEQSDNLGELSEAILKALDSGGKAEFALNLLELENPMELTPPFYIRDGLSWLVEQLREKQKDLGIAVPVATENSGMQQT
ncbi:putative ATP-dependent endonuclease of OLD family [Rhodothalassium salexigens DSM 2132]|uniref:Putative ATP-dependent endonuclease of OLD family n=1 Tax=Rhodothalassium salexigens DSM 2132 TaxID=1188247 RepID=A0A4R2P6N9_RHOSA|nr:AAA family ATPase [Rhodothalassium salexigens]MBB4212777.1 putative ATP-dependent endonuclease of OLD family [Rhodothalassium salexigens DSM 2132]MBK1639778.1 ATP-dependent endonuclease [Rhodothalassium salexigens DSM 2132]TCP29898.1 putative ATP-dependent endonuclease of OLD family [Rhodothalassium salexigens DSM 2132]